MTITIQWWMWCIALFILPFIYEKFRPLGGDYDFHIDSMLVLAVCWFLAIGIIIGKIF